MTGVCSLPECTGRTRFYVLSGTQIRNARCFPHLFESGNLNVSILRLPPPGNLRKPATVGGKLVDQYVRSIADQTIDSFRGNLAFETFEGTVLISRRLRNQKIDYSIDRPITLSIGSTCGLSKWKEARERSVDF